MLTYLESVTKTVNEGAPVDAFYLDFTKAFDSVPHEMLLMKMQSVGVDYNTINWAKDLVS